MECLREIMTADGRGRCVHLQFFKEVGTPCPEEHDADDGPQHADDACDEDARRAWERGVQEGAPCCFDEDREWLHCHYVCQSGAYGRGKYAELL